MRVIFLNRYFYPDHSATSQMLSDLAFFLAGSGHEVRVITSRQRYDDPSAVLPPRERVKGVEVFRVRTTRFGRDNLLGRAADYLTFYLAAGWKLWRIARAGDLVIAKTDPPLISVVAGMVASWRGARLVNWVQDVFPEVAEALGVRALAGPQVRLLRWLRNSALKRAVANVVLSERMAEVVARASAPTYREQARSHRIPTLPGGDGFAKRIHIIPNWADMEAIHPIAAADNRLRREWGLEGHFVVCYSGNMGRAHEFDTILYAAERLAGEERPVAPRPAENSLPPGEATAPRSRRSADLQAFKVRFLLIGGGPQRRAVEDEALRRGLSNVLFRPYQPRSGLSLSLGVGDAHLVSLRPEVEGYIFPSKLYGILAAGRPTVFVGDPKGEIALLVEREGIGVAVRQGDAAGLATALARLAGDAALCQRMGRRARALLCERYDKRISLKAWLNLLEGL